ncbi:MAG: TetR/AcrR family transcriptional regulator [Treponema sp.]|jgi:AcrR family transcriptional regulator|nr:TetR/AcrR family transcriptional regulator [Treponema sp.]
MKRKNISQEKIIQSFLSSAFEKGAGGTSLSDISDSLEIKKASLYNHFENRDAMYDATLDLCKKEISSINFLADKVIDSIKNGKTSMPAVFKRLITRFFNLYETEPLFQIYTFVHTEQFFNYNALQIVLNENEKITDDIRKIFNAFAEIGKIPEYSDKESRELAGTIASIILQQRDLYIANRKEIVRQNPESGAGSLFALPTDDIALNKTIKLIDNIINKVI